MGVCKMLDTAMERCSWFRRRIHVGDFSGYYSSRIMVNRGIDHTIPSARTCILLWRMQGKAHTERSSCYSNDIDALGMLSLSTCKQGLDGNQQGSLLQWWDHA